MQKKYKDIFESYHYLATTPIKVDTALIVALFSLIFVVVGLDFCSHVFANFSSIIFIITNIIIFLGCFVYIANLRETPSSTSLVESKNFRYRLSLKMTRLLQKELIETIEGNEMYRQKENNSLRLLSFVAVFENQAILYIRQPKKVENRKDHDELLAVANDIAGNLGFSISSFQPLYIDKSIGLGHYYFERYDVMYLRK